MNDCAKEDLMDATRADEVRRALIKSFEDQLRATFERLHACSHGHKRSRRGTYRNPPTQRDWKWFLAGATMMRNAEYYL